jgi:hypothetical protein
MEHVAESDNPFKRWSRSLTGIKLLPFLSGGLA